MKKPILLLVSLFALFALVMGAAEARAHKSGRAKSGAIVQVHIDISAQSMLVRVHGLPVGYWKVSTARRGYSTPRGSYRATRIAKVYYSRKYDNSPMPHSVFFKGGYAIHGTGYIKSLGRPASHGCVRLHPSNAARLFSLVQRYGMRQTRITLTN